MRKPVASSTRVEEIELIRKSSNTSFQPYAHDWDLATRSFSRRDIDLVPRWRPRSFRWYFFLLPLVLHLLQAAFVVALLKLPDGSGLKKVSSENHALYLLWQWMPMATVVGAKVCWELLNVDVLRLEPYFQLSRPGGAALKDTLSLAYLNTFSWLVPYQALNRRTRQHTAVALSVIIYILASDILPVALVATYHIDWQGLVKDQPNFLTVNVRHYAGFAVLGVLFAIVVLSICLLVLLSKRNTGLFGDPAGIGGIAALVADSDILRKFRQVRSYDTQAQIDAALGSYQLHLGYDNQSRNPYRIYLLDPEQLTTVAEEPKFVQERSEAHSWWLWGRTYLWATVILIAPIGYLSYASYQAAIQAACSSLASKSSSYYYYYTPAICSNNTFTYNAMAAKLAITIGAIINTAISSNWQSNVALLQPYYRLSVRKTVHSETKCSESGLLAVKCKAKNCQSKECRSKSQLAGSPKGLGLGLLGAPFLTFIRTLRSQSSSAFVGYISFCAVLTQLNVIWTPSIADTFKALEVAGQNEVPPPVVIVARKLSLGISCVVGVLTFVELIMMMRRRRKPFLPRKPTTLSSVILYLCHSYWLLDHACETTIGSKTKRDAHLSGHKFGFGWIQPEGDEYCHVGIEKVENISKPFEYGAEMPENAR